MEKNDIKDCLEELNKICRSLDAEYFINDGYCYYVAYLIARFLEDKGIDYKFAAYRDPWDDKSDIYHYGVQAEGMILNPDVCLELPYVIQFIRQDSRWMYGQFKQNYHPKLSYFWHNHNRRYVNKILKDFFNKYK